ncbi:HU family DNA-binding protein [Bacteroidales bacterium OttesenSCG-928-M06]|nr:HU family DNA-binding protein [Bacteroidales bacterium OttesenSCG-928-M06]
MNSSELILELSKRLQLPKVEVTKRMDDVGTIITSGLLEGKVVSLGNLGSLEPKKRDERISVSPTTGKRMLIPPKLVVKFKSSNSLKEKVKQLKP